MSIFGRFSTIRIAINSLRKKTITHRYDVSKSILSPLDTTIAVQALKTDGLFLGINLPVDIRKEILKFAISHECYGDSNPSLGFKIFQKQQVEAKINIVFNKAQYFNTSYLCPTIQKIVDDPILLEIASQYLETEPIFTGSRLWWIFAVDDIHYDPRQTVSYYHYDLDDYSCVRFFFYLTDVDIHSGPHICIRGSHHQKKITHVIFPFKRRTDEEIAEAYGKENIVTICGQAGFGFAEDTICYHKAERPLEKDRLILQIQYAGKNYGNHNDIMDTQYLKTILD
ncbi:hypothetical protein B6N60_03324 [Richelia sinica FACHB-800]|uniref:Phytanoyl-CoA dioxygenase n=1 Tax=Richelia sinica FACHB-800 TaxID=1357546 RepID=A0A975T9D4_9NOST|nr:hypothetical protein [Richelia sinica]QXE24618.1 hypothetical protein B6N60_03324 [Richelia sinica FACHB-800]